MSETIRFFPGHDRPRETGDLDRMMIAAQNVTSFEPPKKGWMLDSGGFTQLTARGGYDDLARDYVRFVMECQEKIGGLVAAFQQDYPANDEVLEATEWTGKWGDPPLVNRTMSRWIDTSLAIRDLGCETPIAPVLQGRSIEDYLMNLRLIEYTLGHGCLVGIGNLKMDGHGPAFLRELVLQLEAQSRYNLCWHALGVGKRYILDKSAGPTLRRELYSFDSAAWKLDAYWLGKDNHSTSHAQEYASVFDDSTPLFS